MERVSVDLDITSNSELSRGNELKVLVNILVLPAFKELALDNTRVLLCRLINRDGIVREEEGNNEAALEIFGNASVELGGESQDLALIINCLEEVLLWLLRNQTINVTKRIDLVSEAVVGRDLSLSRVTWLRVFDLAEVEGLA